MATAGTKKGPGSAQLLFAQYVASDAETGKDPGVAGWIEGTASQCCVAEYVWLDHIGKTRSKCKTIGKIPTTADDCSIWTFNGKPCGQADQQNSDVYLVPRQIFHDPVRGAPHVMVVCEAITSSMEPAKGNFRCECAEVMEKYSSTDSWFGLEQEYVCCDEWGKPLQCNNDQDQVNPYCGRGAMNLPEGMRDLMGEHYAMCLTAGIKIAGMNVEQGQAQGEFQIGPCKGIEAADHLIGARHTLHKAAQKFRIAISFNAMEKGYEFGSGMHVNYSAAATRKEGGLMFLERIARALSRRQKECMFCYGSGNENRLRGHNDSCDMNSFRIGIADRTATIRIPRQVGITGKGYLEDRRPSANADPYRVMTVVMRTAAEVIGRDAVSFDGISQKQLTKNG